MEMLLLRHNIDVNGKRVRLSKGVCDKGRKVRGAPPILVVPRDVETRPFVLQLHMIDSRGFVACVIYRVRYIALYPLINSFTASNPHSNTDWTLQLGIQLTTFFFYNCVVSMGFLPWENQVAFPRESQLQQSHATQRMVHAGYFSLSIIYRTLTWTTGSLTCAQVLTRGTAHKGVQTYVRESALKMDSGRKIPCRTRELNLHQRHDGPMLYQWATSPPSGSCSNECSALDSSGILICHTQSSTSIWSLQSFHQQQYN